MLRVDTAILLGRDSPAGDAGERHVDGVDEIRAALATYEIALGRPQDRSAPDPAERVRASVEHAWTAYRHGHYQRLTKSLPGLLAGAQRTAAVDPAGRAPLVDAYRVTASLLVKLGVTDLAWLAVDRAMALATPAPAVAAATAVQLGQVLRAAGRPRLAMSATLTAAYRCAPPDYPDGSPVELSLCGSLLVQAALAAARCGDDRAVFELLVEASEMAERMSDGRDDHRTAFGLTAVDLAWATASVELGEPDDAIAWSGKAMSRAGWPWMPAEHRAAGLVDVARAHLQAGDPVAAGRTLVAAHQVAPAEVQCRPVAREALAAVARSGSAPAVALEIADRMGIE